MGLLNLKKGERVEIEVLIEGEWHKHTLYMKDDTFEVTHSPFWLKNGVPVVRVKWVA